MTKDFNIIVCGSPRVGKSTLINAICGKEVAKTSNSLKSCTNKLEKYLYKGKQAASDGVSPPIEYSITFWDTPGVESWSENDVRKHFLTLIHESKPVCMIYCASPGSFLRLEQLQWLVDTCIQSKIFCALVCTNKYSGGSQKRTEVMENFQSLLDQHYAIIKDEANVKYFANVALCTAVNSIVYEDQEMGIKKEAEGINELIFGVMTSLKDHDLAGWCLTVAENNKFWTDMKIKVEEFFRASRPFIRFCCKEVGRQMVSSLIDFILNTASEEM